MTAPARIALSFPPAGLREDAAAAYLGISASKLRQLVEQGRAPRPVRLDGCVIWRRAELDLWLAGLPTEGEGAETPPPAAEAEKWRGVL